MTREASSTTARDHPRVDVVVVSYNSLPHIVPCIWAYLASRGVRCRVLVVDNASSDGTPDVVRRTFGLDVVVVDLQSNVGYGAAVNAAWTRTSAEWVVISNADVTASPEMLAALVLTASVHGAGAASAALRSMDGAPQPGYAKAGVLRRRHRRHCPGGDHLLTHDEYLDGAVLLVSRAAFRGVGGFDERFFFYGEDVALSRALHRAGHRLVHAGAAEGWHARGSDSRTRSPEMLQRSAVWLASANMMNQERHRRTYAVGQACAALVLVVREVFSPGGPSSALALQMQGHLLREYLGYALFGRDAQHRHTSAADGL